MSRGTEKDVNYYIEKGDEKCGKSQVKSFHVKQLSPCIR